ncbi:LysR family transcriptional regulator [Vibrio parahaemolyticus]|nr:LysR family transcriptional regulator [Vibrio parahaemolyticus]
MDLNLINTFLVVVEHKSYTKAAEHLGLTQPAISAAMKRLEQLTNKTLFVKKRTKYRIDLNRTVLAPRIQASANHDKRCRRRTSYISGLLHRILFSETDRLSKFFTSLRACLPPFFTR